MPPKSPSILAQTFLAALPESLRSHATADQHVILRIPGKAPEVGDLVVYDEGGQELIVCVGKIDHSHFEAYCEAESTESERAQRAGQRAAAWIQEIVADRVRFRNEFSAGRLIAGSSWHLDHGDGGRWLKPTDEVREYTWSGEKSHEYRTVPKP